SFVPIRAANPSPEGKTTLNQPSSIVCHAVGLVAIGLLLHCKAAAEDSPARANRSYQEQFLHALHQGPLINTTHYQYVSESIFVPRAEAQEARLGTLSVEKALTYLERGAEVWNNTAKCITCHTNGSYMVYRPILTSALGKPSQRMRDFFVATLRQQ